MLSLAAVKAKSFLEEGTMRGWKQQLKGSWGWEKGKGEKQLKETKKQKQEQKAPQQAK